jgi:hypothetical protein
MSGIDRSEHHTVGRGAERRKPPGLDIDRRGPAHLALAGVKVCRGVGLIERGSAAVSFRHRLGQRMRGGTGGEQGERRDSQEAMNQLAH